jgi:hypothetical protein
VSPTQPSRAGATWPTRCAHSWLVDARNAVEEPLAELVKAAVGAAEAAGTDRAVGVAQSLRDSARMLFQCVALLEAEFEARSTGT